MQFVRDDPFRSLESGMDLVSGFSLSTESLDFSRGLILCLHSKLLMEELCAYDWLEWCFVPGIDAEDSICANESLRKRIDEKIVLD